MGFSLFKWLKGRKKKTAQIPTPPPLPESLPPSLVNTDSIAPPSGPPPLSTIPPPLPTSSPPSLSGTGEQGLNEPLTNEEELPPLVSADLGESVTAPPTPTLKSNLTLNRAGGLSGKKMAKAKASFDERNASLQDDQIIAATNTFKIQEALKNPTKNLGALLSYLTSSGAKRGRFAHEGKLNPATQSAGLSAQSGSQTEADYNPFAKLEQTNVNTTTQAVYNQMISNMVAIHALDSDSSRANIDDGSGSEKKASKAFKPDPAAAINEPKAKADADGDESYEFQLVVNLPTESYMDIQKEKTKNMMAKQSATTGMNIDQKEAFNQARFLSQIKGGAGYKALLELRKRKAEQDSSEFDEEADPALQTYIAEQRQLSNGRTGGSCGHTFVRLKKKIGGLLSEQYSFGFWPEGGAAAADTVGGKVENPDNDSTHHNTNEVVEDVPITKTRLINATTYIRSIIGSAHSYSFAGYNCTSFGMEVAQAAGVSPRNAAMKMTTDTKYNQRVESPAVLAGSYDIFVNRARKLNETIDKTTDQIIEDVLQNRERSLVYTALKNTLTDMDFHNFCDDPDHEIAILEQAFRSMSAEIATSISPSGLMAQDKGSFYNCLRNGPLMGASTSVALQRPLTDRGYILGYKNAFNRVVTGGPGSQPVLDSEEDGTGDQVSTVEETVEPPKPTMPNYVPGSMNEDNYAEIVDQFNRVDLDIFAEAFTMMDGYSDKIKDVPFDELLSITKNTIKTLIENDSGDQDGFVYAFHMSQYSLAELASVGAINSVVYDEYIRQTENAQKVAQQST